MAGPAHIIDMLFYWAKIEPDRLAIIQPEILTTFQGLADAIESISTRIEQLDLNTHEPVAISVANPSFLLATVFALMRCGITVAPVTPAHFPHLRSAGIRHVIYDTEGQASSGGRNIRFEGSWLATAVSSKRRKPYRPNPSRIGDVINFTSGTTGLPKAIKRSSTGFIKKFSSPFNYIQNKALIVPQPHSGVGFISTCGALYAGKTACFAPSLDAMLALIEKFSIDTIKASAWQAVSLAELNARVGYDLSSLQTVRIGGAYLGPVAASRIKTHLCRNIVVRYSSTEAGQVAMAPYDLIAHIPGAVGFIYPGIEVQVVDDADRVLPAGSEGRIRLRTPETIANSALNDVGLHVDAGCGWFSPGDIGRVTEQGILCIVGRNSDVINRGGVKVSGRKIGEVLEALPEVKEAAACGIEGTSGFEEIWIAIVVNAPIGIAEIKRYLETHADVGVPAQEVFVVAKLPRSDAGKIQTLALKEALLKLKNATVVS